MLGLGISGKVLGCTHIKSQDKCALKILKDTAKSRREVDLHWRASGCRHIVNIRDVYENTHNKEKCLMVVMEWSVSGMWMCEAFFDVMCEAFTNKSQLRSSYFFLIYFLFVGFPSSILYFIIFCN